MSELQRLPPVEARKLLALAAVAVKAQQRPVEPVAVIEAHGLAIRNEDADAVVRAVAHLLLAQKRRFREHPEEEASGPLVVDLDDIARHRSTCAVCSEQASRRVQPDSWTPHAGPSVFEDFEWRGPTTQHPAGGTAAEQP
ncbi:MAG: hypothetical protein ACLQHS_13385 [Candidatus Limnocylindrales bacterium]